jgi:hypothetical protein
VDCLRTSRPIQNSRKLYSNTAIISKQILSGETASCKDYYDSIERRQSNSAAKYVSLITNYSC